MTEVTLKSLPLAINEELKEKHSGQISGFLQVGPEKWLLPIRYLEMADEYKNFKVRKDDVWICGYPRSGTTMTQEICWLLTHDLDFERARTEDVGERIKFFERYITLGDNIVHGQDDNAREILNLVKSRFKELKTTKERRLIKTHLPFSLLPPDLLTSGCKIVYIARYVKDVAFSFFNLMKNMPGRNFTGTFDECWDYFQRDLLWFGPYWEYIKQGLDQRNNKNVLVVFYEDIRKDLRGSLQKIAKFLDRDLTKEELAGLEDHMDFENFKKNITSLKLQSGTKVRDYVRKGEVGGWKKHFSPELNARADKWVEENLRKYNLKYSDKYEIVD